MTRNTRKIFGDTRVFDPSKVISLGLIFDVYKLYLQDQLWEEAHNEAFTQLANFNPRDHFHTDKSDDFVDGNPVIVVIRFYTPESNRKSLI